MNVQLNRYEIERYTATTAARADLDVKWHEDPKLAPCTDGKNIYLRKLSNDATQEEAEQLISSAIHEVEHIKHTDFSVIQQNASANASLSVIGAITNCLEDDNIDYKNAEEFIGDRQIRGKVTANYIKGIVGGIKAAYASGEDVPKNTEIIFATIAWEAANTTDYYRETAGMGDEVYDASSSQVRQWVDKLRDGDYRDELLRLRDSDSPDRTMGVFRLSQRIAKEVFEIDPEKEEEEAKQRQEQQAKESGKGKEGKEGDGKGKGSASTMGDGKDGEEAEGEYSVQYKTFLQDQEDMKDPKHSVSKLHIDYEDRDYDGNYIPTPIKDTYVINYVTGTSNLSSAKASDPSTGRLSSLTTLTKKPTEGFTNKVRRLLQIRSKGRWEYGTKKGSLHMGNLYRVGMTDAKGYNERVFKRHITSDTLDTAVSILVDISGSMGGDKFRSATEAALHISNTLGNTLHIPIEMVGFTEIHAKNAMFLYRTFNCKHLNPDKLVLRMAHSGNYMDQNADCDAILWAHNRLLQRKEKRKLIIVLSDGSPASSKAGDCFNYTKKIVKLIEEGSPADIVAVGIQDTNVRKIYKQNQVITHSEELEKALLTIIERKVI